jgi:hypothetical protein
MNYNNQTEQPEPLWQTLLGCLFLALLFGIALVVM